MKSIDLYEYKLDKDSFSFNMRENIDEELNLFMDLYFKILIDIINESQGDLGINKIGDKIRHSKRMKSFFSGKFRGIKVIKATENARSLSKIVLDLIHKKEDAYFIIFSPGFLNTSRIVDKSAIQISDFNYELNKIYESFSLKHTLDFKVVEVLNLPGHQFIENSGYSLLISQKQWS